MEKVQNATKVRLGLLALWDMVIDLQDEVASLVALMEHPEKQDPNEYAWIYRAGQTPERVNLVELAKEVLGNENENS